MISIRVCALLGTTLLATLAACGDSGGSTDIQPTLRFADRSDTELVRLMDAAGGTDMFRAAGFLDQFGDTFEAEACPTITIAGSTATIATNCTRADGEQLTGGGSIDNPIGWDQLDYRYQDDTLYTFDHLTIVAGGTTQTIDGSMRRSDNLATWDADVTVGLFDITVRSDLYVHCSNPQRPSCKFSGSGIELPGIGGALVSGTVSSGSSGQSIDFTLQGADKLTMHSSGNCVAWSIEGTSRGMTCP